MSNLILVFFCLAIGLILQKVKTFPATGYQVLNQFVIRISIPAIALYYIPEIKLNTALLYPLGVAWITFLGSFLLFSLVGNWLGWSKKLIGCLILTAGLGNTSFIGFPLVQALYGTEGLKTAIIIDQPGTFVVLSTLGVAVATIYSRGEINTITIAKRIFTFPPFIAFVVAITLNILEIHFTQDLKSVLQSLATTVTPLALVSVGHQLRIERKSKHWPFLIYGLAYKLLLTPAIIYLLYVTIAGAHSQMIQISIFEAAMAPMITAAIVSASYGLKPRLSSMMIGFGIPISFITLIFWYFVIQYI